jgi:hypothetical protein
VPVLEDAPVVPGRLGLVWLTVGGLALTHFRVLIFYVLFVVVWGLMSLRRRRLVDVVMRIARIGIVAALIFVPWFVHVWGGKILADLRTHVTRAPAERSSADVSYNTAGDLSSYMAPWLWMTFGLAAGVSLWRRERYGTLIVGWCGVLLLATNPHWLGLPGSGAISNFALFLAVYIPASVLIGGLVGRVIDGVRAHAAGRLRLAPVLAILVLVVGVWGADQRLLDVRPEHALVTRPDLRAAAWIRDRLPSDARFWVNSYTSYGSSLILGSDAGWWLPLLTGRPTTLPPMIYGVERGPRPGYRDWVNELTILYQSSDPDAPDLREMLRSRGVTHVYVGQQGARASMQLDGAFAFDPQAFLESDGYRLIYHRDRVWIFEIVWPSERAARRNSALVALEGEM